MFLWVLNFRILLKVLQSTNFYTVSPKVFEYVCFVHIKNVSKLEPKSLRCIFVRYSHTQKGYKCYHPPFTKYFMTIDITFRESKT